VDGLSITRFASDIFLERDGYGECLFCAENFGGIATETVSDPMKEQSERFSFLPSAEHSRGHKNWGANEGQPLRECGSKM